jgi:hypothetical protein
LCDASSLPRPVTGACCVSGDLAGMDERRRARVAAELCPFSSPLPLRRRSLIAQKFHNHRATDDEWVNKVHSKFSMTDLYTCVLKLHENIKGVEV